MNSCFFQTCLILILLIGVPSQTAAEPIRSLCSGYNAEDDNWGWSGIRDKFTLEHYCPDHHVFMAVNRSGGARRPGAFVQLTGNCCPVPEDVLSDTHTFALDTCPKDHVATGAKQVPLENEPRIDDEFDQLWRNLRKQYMRCTKLNERYMLGPRSSGYFVGHNVHIRTAFINRTSRSRIPPSLRYGLGRLNRTNWDYGFCIGLPWGSILVEKHAKYCEDLYFRELQFRGLPGDPPAGSPVLDYQWCAYIEDPLSKDFRCAGVMDGQ